MKKYWTIVDHTDNSGYSVHRTTEKELEFFNNYGFLDAVNTTLVIEVLQTPASLESQIEEAAQQYAPDGKYEFFRACDFEAGAHFALSIQSPTPAIGEDTKRLDWMIANGAALLKSQERFFAANPMGQFPLCQTPREAIDAAMKSESMGKIE